MSVTLRRAVAGDEERLAKLNALVQDLHHASEPDDFKPTNRADSGSRV